MLCFDPCLFICLYVCMYVCVCVCYSSKTKSTERKCLKFGGMLGHEQGTNRLDCGSDRVKGKGLITRQYCLPMVRGFPIPDKELS